MQTYAQVKRQRDGEKESKNYMRKRDMKRREWTGEKSREMKQPRDRIKLKAVMRGHAGMKRHIGHGRYALEMDGRRIDREEG